MEMGELITINEAAKLKGVSRQAIHAAIASGKITVVERRQSTVRKYIAPAVLAAFHPNPKMKRAGRSVKAKRRIE